MTSHDHSICHSLCDIIKGYTVNSFSYFSYVTNRTRSRAVARIADPTVSPVDMTLNNLYGKVLVIHFGTGNRFLICDFLQDVNNFCSRVHCLARIHKHHRQTDGCNIIARATVCTVG